MSTYPGITGTYSPAAWHWAQLFTDGQITDDILAMGEARVEAGYSIPAPPPASPAKIAQRNLETARNWLRRARDDVRRADLELKHFGTNAVGLELYGARLAFAEAEMVRCEAWVVDAELALKEAV